MTTPSSRLRIRKENDVSIIEFIDRNILDEANIAQISDEICTVVEQQTPPRILISFSNVDHLSSAALGALITIHNNVAARDGQLRLADINDQIIEVFKITRLDHLFQICPGTPEALASFS